MVGRHWPDSHAILGAGLHGHVGIVGCIMTNPGRERMPNQNLERTAAPPLTSTLASRHMTEPLVGENVSNASFH